MRTDKGIFIKNIYYMLSYAFHALKQEDYEKVAAESFDKTEDLFAAILARGVSVQLKRGLYREYVSVRDNIAVVRGKVELANTLRLKQKKIQKLSCNYDEFSENNIYNQILKTTMQMLLHTDNVDNVRKNELKKLIVFFSSVDTVEIRHIKWNKLIYGRNNRSYELLLNICYLLITGMLQTTENGGYKMMSFSDENMEKLFERFVLSYYKEHHSELSPNASQIKWDISQEDTTKEMIHFLPKMQSDITLQRGNKTLIIDAKYYGQSLAKYYDKSTLRSAHLYQIFTYVKNYDIQNTGNVSGLLLYAKTENEIFPDMEPVTISGNKIGAYTLDLNVDFKHIAKQLDRIAEIF